MAVPLADVFVAVILLASLVLCWFGYYSYRTWNEPGVRTFAAFTATVGVAGLVLVGADVLLEGPESALPPWALVGIICVGIAMLPWVLFTLQFTGQYTRIRWPIRFLLSVPLLGYAPIAWTVLIGEGVESQLINLTVTLAFWYSLSLLIIGVYLLFRTTKRYGHLSLTQGGLLSAGAILLFISVQTTGIWIDQLGRHSIGVYAGSFVVLVGATGLALFRYEIFDATPAVGTIGERMIARTTDDLVFVVDQQGRLIKLNETAVELLGVTRTGLLGDSLDDVLDVSIEELQTLDTLTLQTKQGQRQFDPQVSSFTDQHDRHLGYLASLRDVTNRELRQQRLAVFNRILRHNHRNQLEVIKANAEVLADQGGRDHTAPIIDAAEKLQHLSQNARSIDQLLSRPLQHREIDLTTAVYETLDSIEESRDGVSITVSGPDEASLVTDRRVIDVLLDSALDNALTHAESSVQVVLEQHADGYVIEIADDGDGIPEMELASITAGTETAIQHGTGLGLWQLKWATTKLNGTLEFDTDDGTVIRVTIPDQKQLEQEG